MSEKFTDVYSFCQHASKLMVAEIRRRASNRSLDAASTAIVAFLQIQEVEEESSGWMLLQTLNLLSAGDESLIEVGKTRTWGYRHFLRVMSGILDGMV